MTAKQYRRRCYNCRCWVIVNYKGRSSGVFCEDCKSLRAKIVKPSMIRVEKETWWKVVQCPDPYGYRPGASFSDTEVRAMKLNHTLIPGMVLTRMSEVVIAVNDHRLKEAV